MKRLTNPKVEVEVIVSSNDDASELPKGWSAVTLRQTVEFKKGKKPTELRNEPALGFVPYLDIQAIQEKNIRQFADMASSRLSESSDVLVVWDGARSGLVGMAPAGAIGSTIMALSSKVLDAKYLRNFLASQYDTINSNTRGTGIPHVDPEVFWNLSIPIAPFAEQRRIVAKLEELLGKVSSSQQRLSRVPGLLKRFRQSVLAAACSGRLTADWREENVDVESASELLERLQAERQMIWLRAYKSRKYQGPERLEDDDLGPIPDSWVWTNFDHCASEITVGHVGPMKDRYVESGIAFLRSQNVRPLRFNPIGLVRIPKDFEAKLAKSRLTGGEILVVRSGANTGDCCVFPRGMEEANCADLVITRPLFGLCAEYGAMYVASPIGQAAIGLRQTGIAQPHFNIGAMRVKPFPLPPLLEQQEIVRRVEKLFAFADQIEARLKHAQEHVDRLTQSILAKAFRGELVPTEAELARREGRAYETASELLARIQATQATTAPPKPKRKKSSQT
jgi:type I restriction enzyme S subunit